MPLKSWFTYEDLRELLRVTNPRTTRRLIRPYRSRCHLARIGSHPRRLLLIPRAVVSDLCRARGELWRLGVTFGSRAMGGAFLPVETHPG